jgi:large subunit ribosomal protein L21
MAIITTGGKQYIIKPDQSVAVEKLSLQVGDTLALTDLLTGELVNLQVVEHTRGAKVVIRKFRNKTRYHRLRGHRQPLTMVRLAPAKPTNSKPTRTRRKTAEDKPAKEA